MAIFSKKRIPIAWALRLFFALLTGALLLGAWLVFFPWISSTMIRLENESLSHENGEVLRAINSFLDHRLAALNDLSHLPQISQGIQPSPESQQDLGNVLENLTLLGSACQLVLVDPLGRTLHSSKATPRFDYRQKPWLAALVNDRSSRHIGISRSGKESFWQLAIPVTIDQQRSGILIAELPVKDLQKEKQLFSGIEDGQLEILFDNQVIATFGQSSSKVMNESYFQAADITLRLRSNRFNLEYALRQLLLKFVSGLIILTLLLFILAHRLNRHFIARPIEQLRQLTKSLAGGEKPTAEVTHPLLEVSLLAEDFNNMAKQIEQREQALTQARDTLEIQVMERTAKLSTSEAALQAANENLEQLVEQRTLKLKQTQGQLLMQEKMASIGQLAAGIAHELNNPLNFVHTNFDTLEKNMTDFRKLLGPYRQLVRKLADKGIEPGLIQSILQQEDASNIDFVQSDIEQLFSESRIGLERINSIVRSMRNFSRVDQVGERALYDLNKGINDTLIIARNEYKDLAEIHTALGEIPSLLCCPQQINQVLLNLIVNATQAIASQQRRQLGRIEINSWQEQLQICISISDDGPGVPAELQHRIFEPFFTTKEVGKGTGLGLSISYDIVVHKHAGELTLDSGYAGGARFLIRLPIDSDLDS